MASYTPKSLTLEKDGDKFIYNFDDKVDVNQGAQNAGKALGVNAQGQVEPVDFTGVDFSGATASTAGTHGYVPAPSIGDQDKFLKGDGSWGTVDQADFTGATSSLGGVHGMVPAPSAGDQMKVLQGDGSWGISPGAKKYPVTLTVTNVSGAYDQTFTISDVAALEVVSEDMIVDKIEISNPNVFDARLNFVCGNGTIRVRCDDVAGTSTIVCWVQKVITDPQTATSTEFDILNNRINRVIQECGFELVNEDGVLKLYCYTAYDACPYSIVYENGAYNLYFEHPATA